MDSLKQIGFEYASSVSDAGSSPVKKQLDNNADQRGRDHFTEAEEIVDLLFRESADDDSSSEGDTNNNVVMEHVDINTIAPNSINQEGENHFNQQEPPVDFEAQRLVDINRRKKRSKFQFENQMRRLQGKRYKGRRKQVDKPTSLVDRPEKKLEPPCDENNSCRSAKNKVFMCNKFSDCDRERIFQAYWSLPSRETKVVMVKGLVSSSAPARPSRSLSDKAKSNSYKYFLTACDGEKLRVCKKMFCSTISISTKTLDSWLASKTENSEGAAPKERQRGKAGTRSKVFLDKVKKLEEILSNLSRIPSHYCRADTDQLFLERNWPSKRKMYKWYRDEVGKTSAVSRTIFEDTLRKMKLSIFHWKKDLCSTCEASRIAGKDVRDTDHFKEKVKALQAKKQLKSKLKNMPNTECFAMDLQSALSTPRLFVNAAFYKLKLLTHNFTFCNLKNKEVDCITFTEVDAGHACHVYTSCVVHYIEELLGITSETEHVVIVSDNCAYQNKNSVLSNSLTHVAMSKAVSIEHRYLVPGHTHMEPDYFHSLVERRISDEQVYTPSDYEKCMLDSTDNGVVRVHPKTYDFFKQYNYGYRKAFRPGHNGEPRRPTVTQVRAYLYQPDGSVLYKLAQDDEFVPLKEKFHLQKSDAPTPLYMEKQKLAPAKVKHLRDLMAFIPADKQTYYEENVFGN